MKCDITDSNKHDSFSKEEYMDNLDWLKRVNGIVPVTRFGILSGYKQQDLYDQMRRDEK